MREGTRQVPVMRRFFAILAVAVVALSAWLAPSSAWAKGSSLGEPSRLEVPNAPDAYFYRPHVKGTRPILMYLHGRGGHPADDCRKWARVAARYGWVVCPSGPVDVGGGGRSWANGAGEAQRVIDATVAALRAKYKGRVQRRGNVLIGFSEGAFIAMQVGLKEQATWSRWLILGAAEQYWPGDIAPELAPRKRKVKRVYLLTGENDGVAPSTQRVGERLKQLKVPVRVKIATGLGHEVPKDRMITMYRRPLAWLLAAK